MPCVLLPFKEVEDSRTVMPVLTLQHTVLHSLLPGKADLHVHDGLC